MTDLETRAERLGVGVTRGAESLDVAVVGGGVAGCYAAYRLTGAARERRPAERPIRVGLFEAAARLGGRLWSHLEPGPGSVPAELGGMRFTRHLPALERVIEELGLSPEVEVFELDRPENLCFLRGVRLRRADLTSEALARDPHVVPYELRLAERGCSAADLVLRALTAVLPELPRLRAEYHAAIDRGDEALASDRRAEYERARETARVGGAPLHDVRYPALLAHALSAEAIAFIEDAGGYETTWSTGSAACWIDCEFFQVPADGPSLRLEGGFEAIPRALHARFDARGGATFLEHELIRIERPGPERYRLTFRTALAGDASFSARAVLLALPECAIRRLGASGLGLDEGTLAGGCAAVRPVPAFKLFVDYPEPWWRRAGVRAGRSTTTLPIRQCFYLGGETRHRMMAAYVNGPDVGYWRDLAGGDHAPGEHPRPASEAMLRKAHEQLVQVHGIADVPAPLGGFFHDWCDAPHGTAWYVWEAGSRPGEVHATMLRPRPDEPLFVAGSCWSLEPGSVHGALGTVDEILHHYGAALVPGPRP